MSVDSELFDGVKTQLAGVFGKLPRSQSPVRSLFLSEKQSGKRYIPIFLILASILAFASVLKPALTSADPDNNGEGLTIDPVLNVEFITFSSGGVSSDGSFVISGMIGDGLADTASECGVSISSGAWIVITEVNTETVFGNSFEFEAKCD